MASSSSARRARAAAGILALFALCCAWPAPTRASAQAAKSSTPPLTCATCHAGVVASYSHAPMRHAMEAPGSDPTLAAHPSLAAQLNGFTYSVQTKNGRSTYAVTDGTNSLSLPIRWIFGQNMQTWILEKDGRSYESMVSYFPREQQLAATPGDEKLIPRTVAEAMGRELSPWEVRSCFGCHSTNSFSNGNLTLDKLRPGLDCERCHTGAQQHMADAARENFSSLPKSLKRMSSEDISTFCGQCHRSWDTVLRNHFTGLPTVRFQPYRLEMSKCFIGNDPRISCLTCHNPHQPLIRDDAFYDAKCKACHAAASASAKICPVSKTQCVSCHMPKVQLAAGHALFTDHDIRIVQTGQPYPN